MRAHWQRVLQEKEAKDAEAQATQKLLGDVKKLLEEENVRVRESQARAQELSLDNEELKEQCAALQRQYQQACHLKASYTSSLRPHTLVA